MNDNLNLRQKRASYDGARGWSGALGLAMAGMVAVLPARAEFAGNTRSNLSAQAPLGMAMVEYRRPGSLSDTHLGLEYAVPLSAFGRQGSVATFVGSEEQRLGFGLGMTDATQLLVFGGQGANYTRTRSAFSDFNPYYFHGGNHVDFNYQGAMFSTALSQNKTVYAGLVNVEADELERRSSHYLGWSGRQASASMMWVSRGDKMAGRGLNLSLDFSLTAKPAEFSYQGVQSTTGATQQILGFNVQATPASAFGLRWQQHANPLLEGDAARGQQVMLTYTRTLGRIPMSVDGNTNGTNINRGLMIGGAALGAALVLSSGSGDQDNARRLDEQHAVAQRTLNRINPISVRENKEYGGLIYRTADGRYAMSRLEKGDVDSVNLTGIPVPAGTTVTASLHTHGGPDPRYANEVFSPQDIAVGNHYKIDGYLGTPGGRFLWHDYRGGRVVLLGTVAN